MHGTHQNFIQSLIDRGFTDAQVELIDCAYEQAKAAHRNVFRQGGARYFEHVRAVADILINECECKNTDLLVAAFLHDVVEDSALYGSHAVPGRDPHVVAHHRLTKFFNLTVADTVLAVTKRPRTGDATIDHHNHEEYLDGLRKAPINALIIKMADRLHNLRSLPATSIKHQKKQIRETTELYYPIFARAVEIDTSPQAAILFGKIKVEIGKLTQTG